MSKYKVTLEMYGTVIQHGNITIEADSVKEAENIALDKCAEGEVYFNQQYECTDGWIYDVTNVERKDE